MSIAGIQLIDVTSGIRSGYGNVSSFFKVQSKSVEWGRGSIWLSTTWKTVKTTLKMNRIFQMDPIMTRYKTSAIGVAALLVLSNTLALVSNAHKITGAGYGGRTCENENKTGFDHFLCEIWKATPYLLVLTNVALTALEFRQNPTKATVGFAFTAITTVDRLGYLPRGASWFLNRALPLPTAAIALYYGNWASRTIVAVDTAGFLITC